MLGYSPAAIRQANLRRFSRFSQWAQLSWFYTIPNSRKIAGRLAASASIVRSDSKHWSMWWSVSRKHGQLKVLALAALAVVVSGCQPEQASKEISKAESKAKSPEETAKPKVPEVAPGTVEPDGTVILKEPENAIVQSPSEPPMDIVLDPPPAVPEDAKFGTPTLAEPNAAALELGGAAQPAELSPPCRLRNRRSPRRALLQKPTRMNQFPS